MLQLFADKNRSQLETAAASLNTQVRKIGKVLDTRWVLSSFRTVSAVLSSYSSLVNTSAGLLTTKHVIRTIERNLNDC